MVFFAKLCSQEESIRGKETGIPPFLFSILGTYLGFRFGRALARRLKPGILGGIILILIGVKILVSHLWGVG